MGVMRCKRFAIDVMNGMTGDTIVLRIFGIGIRDIIGSLLWLAVNGMNGESVFAYSAN